MTTATPLYTVRNTGENQEVEMPVMSACSLNSGSDSSSSSATSLELIIGLIWRFLRLGKKTQTFFVIVVVVFLLTHAVLFACYISL